MTAENATINADSRAGFPSAVTGGNIIKARAIRAITQPSTGLLNSGSFCRHQPIAKHPSAVP